MKFKSRQNITESLIDDKNAIMDLVYDAIPSSIGVENYRKAIKLVDELSQLLKRMPLTKTHKFKVDVDSLYFDALEISKTYIGDIAGVMNFSLSPNSNINHAEGYFETYIDKTHDVLQLIDAGFIETPRDISYTIE